MGSIGAGIEGYYHFDDQFALRLGLNTYKFTGTRIVDDIDYDYDLKMRSGGLMLDIFPRGKRFYLTGGIIVNGNSFEGDARIVDSITIGRTTYAAADVGEFGGKLDFQPIAPYVGLGWRWRNNQRGLNLGVEAGLMFHGQGDVTLRATGPIADDPDFIDDVEREVDEVEDQLGIAKLFPVVEGRISYRF